MAKGSMVPTTAAGLTASKRQQAIKKELSKFGDDLYDIYIKLADSEKKLADSALRHYHRFGKLCIKAHNEYKNEGIAALARALERDADLLRKTIKFAEKISTEELEELVTGDMSWSNVRLLLGVSDEKERARLTTQAMQNRWDVRTLQEQIRKKFPRKGSGGRSFKAPANISSGINRALTVSRKFQEQLDSIWVPHVLDKLVEMDVVDDADELNAGLAELRIEIEQMLVKLDDAYKKLETISLRAPDPSDTVDAEGTVVDSTAEAADEGAPVEAEMAGEGEPEPDGFEFGDPEANLIDGAMDAPVATQAASRPVTSRAVRPGAPSVNGAAARPSSSALAASKSLPVARARARALSR